MSWKHYQTVDPPSKYKREPQVGRGLFGDHQPILHFKSPIFLNFTSPLGKNISFPKFPNIHTKPPNSGQRNKQRDLTLLEM